MYNIYVYEVVRKTADRFDGVQPIIARALMLRVVNFYIKSS